MIFKLLFFCFLSTGTALAINSQSYFKDSLNTYKNDFKNRAQFLISKDPRIKLSYEKIEITPDWPDENLPQIDYLLIPSADKSAKKKNLIIIQSGVHGIEGLTGAGIQNFLLEDLHMGKEKFNNTAFLYIHLVNPSGTYFGRRTNLNNVDLNRNFVLQQNSFQQTSPEYEQLNYFLNPQVPFESGLFKKLSYLFDSISLIYRFSTDVLRRSILKGQYQFPKGIYYGGDNYQPEMKALNSIWDSQTQGYQKVIYIDLHTGYGEKGKLHLLAGHSESESSKKITDLYSPTPIDFGNTKNFYETNGDVLTYFTEKYKKQSDIIPVTFEFGTLNSQSTWGSIESLYRMRSENQAFQYKSADAASDADIKKLFKEMFYPSEFEWRDQVLAQTKAELDKIIKRLETAE